MNTNDCKRNKGENKEENKELENEALQTKPGAAIEEPHQIEGEEIDDPKSVEEIQDTVEMLGVGPDTRERG